MAPFSQRWVIASPSCDAEGAHDRVQPLAGEDAQEVVLAGEEELGDARVALAAGAAAQLVVDAPALVPLGARARRGRQRRSPPASCSAISASISARFFRASAGVTSIPSAALLQPPALHPHVDVAAELNVGAAAGHVGGDGDRARHPGVGDDEGFLLVVAGVQHLVRDAGAGSCLVLELVLLEQAGQRLRLLDRDRADQDRLAAHVAVLDLLDDGAVLLAFGAIDLVVVVGAANRPVGRDLGHVHPVDVAELLRLGGGRAGHAGKLAVEAEVILDGDRGQGLVLGLDVDAFLGLDRLVQALPTAAGRSSCGR